MTSPESSSGITVSLDKAQKLKMTWRKKEQRRSSNGRHKTDKQREKHRLAMRRYNKTPKYKLMGLAHTAVKKAMTSGILIKMPCEVCGGDAHAHHDSYAEDKRLEVRWLCNRHHIEWHYDNEPLYPQLV